MNFSTRLAAATRDSITRTMCIALGLGILAAVSLQAEIVMPPYLQSVSASSVCVLVECDTADAVTVDFGLTDGYGSQAVTATTLATTAVPVTYVHRIPITGLLTATAYHYRARQLTSTSADAAFTTSAPAGTGFRLGWAADSRTGGEVFDRIAELLLAATPQMLLHGGDTSITGDYANWKSEFFRPPNLALIGSVPFFLAAGNHEGWSANTLAFTQAPDSAGGTLGYYSLDAGDLHVLVLNNQLPYDAASPQYAFAVSDLAAATTRKWKMVIAHTPAYVAGSHGEDPGMITLTQNVFEPAGVDLTLTGHSHFYQHNVVNNIHHLVIGSAGAPLVATALASYTLTAICDYNFATVDVSSDWLDIVVRNDRGGILDSFRLTKTWVDPGDLNEDGGVDAVDLQLLADYLSGSLATLPADRGSQCGDSGISAADMTCLAVRLFH